MHLFAAIVFNYVLRGRNKRVEKNCFKLKISITFLYINGKNDLKFNSDDTCLL